MKATDQIGQYYWRKLSSQIPSDSQAEQIAGTIKKVGCNEAYRITMCNPVKFAGHIIQVETRIVNRWQAGIQTMALHDHTSKGTVTHYSNSKSDIANAWHELYYTLKGGFEPLKE